MKFPTSVFEWSVFIQAPDLATLDSFSMVAVGSSEEVVPYT